MIPTHCKFQGCQGDRVIWPEKRRATLQLLAHPGCIAIVCSAQKLFVFLKLSILLIRPKLSFISLAVTRPSLDLRDKSSAIRVNEMQRDLLAARGCLEQL